MTFWHAPTLAPEIRIAARIRIPASKSLTNRYLILGALSSNPTIIHSPLRARDTELMAQALRTLGTKISEIENSDSWLIEPQTLHGGTINAGLAGTVMRFIPPLAALATGDTLLDGDLQARKRPMHTTIASLRNLGVTISGSGANNSALPLKISGQGQVQGGEISIDASASSQFVSALLLAGARFTNGLTLRHTGKQLPSLPHIEMTCEVLEKCGVKVESQVENGIFTWHVAPGTIRLPETAVESDLSNAGPFLAAAMVQGGTVTIPNWPLHTTQPGAQFVHIFAGLGAKTEYLPDASLRLTAPEQIAPLDLDCHAIGELVPTLAAVCTFATGSCALRNIAQLRGHETDRLAALVSELKKVGVSAQICDDDLLIRPPDTPTGYHGARLSSYADHRMATFGAILGLRIAGIEVENIATTAKTLPNFTELWEDLVHQSTREAEQSANTQSPLPTTEVDTH